jgi:hypothetical protein
MVFWVVVLCSLVGKLLHGIVYHLSDHMVSSWVFVILKHNVVFTNSLKYGGLVHYNTEILAC